MKKKITLLSLGYDPSMIIRGPDTLYLVPVMQTFLLVPVTHNWALEVRRVIVVYIPIFVLSSCLYTHFRLVNTAGGNDIAVGRKGHGKDPITAKSTKK